MSWFNCKDVIFLKHAALFGDIKLRGPCGVLWEAKTVFQVVLEKLMILGCDHLNQFRNLVVSDPFDVISYMSCSDVEAPMLKDPGGSL